MPTKLNTIRELSRETLQSLSGDIQNWTGFLHSAAYLYKYPFHDQVLIYAQRPDATACASFDLWNNRMKRYINRGAKGIALIQDSGNSPILRYVFDAADTNSRETPEFRIWEMRNADQAVVLEELGNHFGVNEDFQDLPFQYQLHGILENAIADNITDYAAALQLVQDESNMTGFGEDDIEAQLKEALQYSVGYVCMTRLGVDADAYFNEMGMHHPISDFNTLQTITVLGQATSDISEMVLRQIERSVRENQRAEHEKFAKEEPIVENEEKSVERGVEHGQPIIHTDRRLPDTGIDIEPSVDGRDRQIWADAQEVLAGASKGAVQLPSPDGGASDSPVGNRQVRTDAGAADHSADGAGRGRDRDPESSRPDGVGAADEQHPAPGRGDSDSGLNQQLGLFPTEAAQIQGIQEAEAARASAFSISQEEIDRALTAIHTFSRGKLRIFLYFQDGHTNTERAAFLKNEYGIGGQSYTFLDDSHGWFDHDSKGVRFSSRGFTAKHSLSWSIVAKRIQELIAANRYLTDDEMDTLPAYRQEIATKAQVRQLQEATLQEAAAQAQGDKQYYFSLGDTVHIGISEHAILSLAGDTVTLSDTKYPLLTVEMPREEFERKVRENPHNDHLIPDTIAGITVEIAQDGDTLTIDPVEGGSGQYVEMDITLPDAPAQPEPQPEPLPEQADVDEAGGVPYKSVVIDLRPQPEPGVEAPEPAKPANFRITDDNLGHGGQKTKYGYNVAAIRTLKQIEQEHLHAARRNATPEEQEALSRYVGWGGIPQAFDEHNDKWANEYAELKGLLTEKEYEAARASTLNAHYTSPVVIKAMYETISRIGFSTGNILEPAMGVGNFFGLLPESMQASKLYGVELDSITGRIAQQLYPDARIAVQGYEDTNLPDSFFDLAVGNVPFGGFGVSDRRYEKNKFFIHDYFFAKTLDKVRPGGVIAFISSKGTMDKKNPEVRKYIAQRAELLGAVRLPSNAFYANAGTEVTTDILFLQRRETPIEHEPDWVHLSQTEDGIPINAYYAAHPEMVLGKMVFDDKMYGNAKETACQPIEGADLKQQLQEALSQIEGSIPAYAHEQEGLAPGLDEDTPDTIPADPDVRNFSYTLVEGQIYYREDSIMRPVETSVTGANRMKGMIELRDCVRSLIDMQMEDYPNAAIAREQQRLNTIYDAYTKKYGILNSRGNEMAFSDDSGYFLLCSLEVLNDEQEFLRKADMFTKRTIRPQTIITSVETPAEALAVSISEHGKVDIDYMQALTGMSEEAIAAQLQGVLFRDIVDGGFVFYRTSDEFLSGNVREKLRRYEHLLSIAPEDYEHLPLLQANVEALQAVQPKDLCASEIDVRLGATWLPAETIKQFMNELLDPDWYAREKIQVLYSQMSGTWNITNKSGDHGNEKANRTYGTKRINAYKIIENTLNLRDVRIFDIKHEDGKEKRVLNAKETVIAQQKQQAIKDAFADWIWKDPHRRETLTRLYNDQFNCIVQREYNGEHIRFVGMNPEIKLRPHQVNAVAQALYGGNTLLAHTVGAGKTYTMAAIAMESKRLGLSHKSMIVVPNHIIGQFAGEFLQLYPSANILVANKKDFEPANRKKFCARIATGDYDAVIIGHSQFEKIPMSVERQCAYLENEISEVVAGIQQAKWERAENFTIKQMEATKKSLEVKLNKLNNTSRKDNVIDFEALGVNRLMVDEADNYKNLFLYTKMRNVAGIAQTEAQKSSDLFIKSQYINEITDDRGMVFATGTPISNSMVELYTMQRYLQYNTLKYHGLQHFDAWASTFGEQVTAIEIAPEGTGYRAKTRFSKFFNLPELLSMFRLVADIQTKDMLDLPTPKVNYHTVALKPSDLQREMVTGLAERAEKVRTGGVLPTEDNMLKITNDGRKLALDQRLMNDMLPDGEDSKTNACVEKVVDIWARTAEKRLTQLVFCDLSTPKGDGSFNVYEDMREKLIASGIPAGEIAFIHDANTDERKIKLFGQVRSGQVRILMGSTFKMGAGTNVQTRLVAEHHLDCPWRPRDIEQREGRIDRQGNENEEVDIYRYVTEGSFDSYLWQTIEGKQRFISQIMTSKTPARSCEDVDEAVLNYAEVKALAAGDPDIKERMQLDTDVKRLKMLKANYLSNKYELEDTISKRYPAQIQSQNLIAEAIEKDIALFAPHQSDDFPGMELCGMHFTEKAKAGAALLETCKAQTDPQPHPIGRYCGFKLLVEFNVVSKCFYLSLDGNFRYRVELGQDIHGNIQRLDNQLQALPKKLAESKAQIAELERQRDNAKAEMERPFPQELELKQKQVRLAELDAKLKINERGSDAALLDAEPEAGREARAKVMER